MTIVINFNAGADREFQRKVLKELRKMSAKFDTVESLMTEFGVALDEVAGDIDELLERIAGGLTPGEADSVIADMAALRDRVKGIAEVVPEAEPEPPVEP